MTHPNGPQDHNAQQMPYGQLPPQGYSPQPHPEKKPIYKKKRFILPVAAIVIIGGAMAFNGGGDDNPISTSASESGGEGQNAGPAAIGDTVHLDNAATPEPTYSATTTCASTTTSSTPPTVTPSTSADSSTGR